MNEQERPVDTLARLILGIIKWAVLLVVCFFIAIVAVGLISRAMN